MHPLGLQRGADDRKQTADTGFQRLFSIPDGGRAELFVARYWYGLPVEEIAAKLGMKKNTALSTLRRMRLRLRDRLEKEGLQ